MNAQVKTILLTIATLSLFVIALVELSGVSSTALINKLGGGKSHSGEMPRKEEETRETRAGAMPKTEITFLETVHNFGTIKEGEVAVHDFHFRNTGTQPLFIASAQASCGCTIPSFPQEPIAPGGEGDIKVQFNSKGRTGHQKKNVIITCNGAVDKVSIGFEADVAEQ